MVQQNSRDHQKKTRVPTHSLPDDPIANLKGRLELLHRTGLPLGCYDSDPQHAPEPADDGAFPRKSRGPELQRLRIAGHWKWHWLRAAHSAWYGLDFWETQNKSLSH